VIDSDLLNEPWAPDLIRKLAGGGFLSGEALAKDSGLSRVAIWKRIERLQVAGITVESQRRKGYRIAGGLDLLDQLAIRNALSDEVSQQIPTISVMMSTDSTNSDTLDALSSNPDSQAIVMLAEQQVNGRGRRGRTWVSPFASNIYMTVGWKFASGAAALEGLSLAVGIAVVEAVESCGAHNLQLKWPNDIWSAEGKKLGGILIEMIGSIDGPVGVAVGIGLNMTMSEDDAAKIDQPWSDLCSEIGGNIGRNDVVGALLNHIVPVLATYEESGFSQYARRWKRYDCLDGREVNVHLPLVSEVGVARGVDKSGALKVEVSGEIKTFTAGEISIRPR